MKISEIEMEEHCKKYACSNCPIAWKCAMFKMLFGYNPKREKCKNENL